MASSSPKKNKKVSFATNAKGFEFKDDKKDAKVHDDDHKRWNRFGSLSKSEFSFMSDRSSFAASLNTLSGAHSWLDVDPQNPQQQQTIAKADTDADIYNGNDQELSQLSQLSPKSTDVAPFTFGGNSAVPNSSPHFNNFISNDRRKLSMSSPSLNARHSRSAVSVTFSATVSLFNEHDKRQNSMLFYDLWGIPAKINRMARSDSAASQSQSANFDLSEDKDNSMTEPMPRAQSQLIPMHRASSSLSSSIGFGSIGSFAKQSSMVAPANRNPHHEPVLLEDEENDADDWSGFDMEQSEVDMFDEDESHGAMHANKDSLSGVPVPVKKQASSSLSGFKYRKRKSLVTANFVFGNSQAQK